LAFFIGAGAVVAGAAVVVSGAAGDVCAKAALVPTAETANTVLARIIASFLIVMVSLKISPGVELRRDLAAIM
jgi:hypothetical protein